MRTLIYIVLFIAAVYGAGWYAERVADRLCTVIAARHQEVQP